MRAAQRCVPRPRSLNRTAQALVVSGLCLGLTEGEPIREALPARTPEQAARAEVSRWLHEPWYRQPHSMGSPGQHRIDLDRRHALTVVPSFDPPSFGLYGSDQTFVDIDGDGDFDAFSGTRFLENRGTPRAPAFAPPRTHSFGLSSVNHQTAFADIDADGDFDAFIGARNGSTFFFENKGTAQAPAFPARLKGPFGLIDVDQHTSPAFVDIDGDFDAFIGKDDGKTLFFENTGTPRAPAFAAPRVNPFGLIDVSRQSAPAFADIDADGDFDAFIGS